MNTFDTPEPITVTIEIGVGDIRIEAGDRSDTVVDVRPSNPSKKGDVAAAEQTGVEYAAGRLQVKALKGWRRFTPWGGGESIDISIELPAGSNIRAEAAVASLRCTGRLGEFRYRTSVGDIDIDQAGPVELQTVAGRIVMGHALGSGEFTATGDISIGTVDGNAVVKNNNGDTWIGTAGGHARVNAANGKVVVDRAQTSVVAKTACGDIRIGEVSRGAIVAETAFGTIDVGIRAGVPAWLDISTGFGTVSNGLDASSQPESSEEAVEIRAQTSFGDVNVVRSSVPRGEKEKA